MFKIVNDASFHLEQEQIDFLFDEIMKTPPASLGMEEMQTLSELGKYSKSGSTDFQQKISGFFWKLITESD